MLERVVLHIGLAKTGTKTLQAAMTLNRDLLRRHGFVYPALPGERHAGLVDVAPGSKVPSVYLCASTLTAMVGKSDVNTIGLLALPNKTSSLSALEGESSGSA